MVATPSGLLTRLDTLHILPMMPDIPYNFLQILVTPISLSGPQRSGPASMVSP